MITIRRSEDRRHDRNGRQDVWHTFLPAPAESDAAQGFGLLESLQESEIQPAGFLLRHAERDAEILTYVRLGALLWEDSQGGSGLVQAGEFWRMTSGTGVLYREANASRTHPVHVVQVWLRPEELHLETSHQQRRFTAAERRGSLCLIGSPDGRGGGLSIRQDAAVFTALLDPGTHIAHSLAAGRSAWLQVLEGEVALADHVLRPGDGAGLTDELAVSFSARGNPTEILLMDLGPPSPE